jgi:putative DNA primase/helicase
MKARFMRQDFFEYLPQLKLIIFGNHKPALRSVNEAMRSRIHFLPYNTTIKDKDKDFAEKLKAEWEEILAWMVEGARLWHEQELNPPQCVIDATEKYISEQDKFQMFVEDYLELSDRNAFTPTRKILRCQHSWAEQQNEWKMREKDLIEAMESKGCRYGRTRVGGQQERGFFGCQISKLGFDNHLISQMAETSAKRRTYFN